MLAHTLVARQSQQPVFSLRAILTVAFASFIALLTAELRAQAAPLTGQQAPFAWQSGGAWQAAQKVFGLAQTPDGFLWAGTDSGLVRYDGRTLKRFTSSETPTLRENIITALAVDVESVLWLGLANGRGLAAVRDGQVVTAATGVALAGHSITTLLPSADGTLWAGTQEGLFRFHKTGDKDLQPVLDWPRGPVFALAPSLNDEAIWIAGSRGLCRATKLGIEIVFPLHDLSAILPQSDGSVLVTSASAGLLRLKEGAEPVTMASTPPENHESKFSALALAPDGNVWVGWGRGVGVLDASNIKTVVATASEVVTLLPDQEGNIWAATFWGVVHKAHVPRVVITNHSNNGKFPVAFGVSSEPDGSIWAVQHASVVRIDLANASHHLWESGSTLASWCPRGVTRGSSGRIWVATCDKGLLRYEAGEFTNIGANHPPNARNLHSLFESRDGRVWLGSNLGGVYFLDAKGIHELPLATGTCSREQLQRRPGVQEECAFAVVAIAESANGTMWFATGGAGLYRLDDTGIRSFQLGDGLPTNILTALATDGDDVWIGTQGHGLVLLRGDRFRTFDASSGMPGRSVHGVLPNVEGWMWLSTEEGVARVDRRHLKAHIAGQRPTLGAALLVSSQSPTPFIAVQGYTEALHFSPGRALLVPTDQGILWVSVDQIADTTNFAAPLLESVRLAGVPKDPKRAQRVDLPLGVGFLTSLTYQVALPNFRATDRTSLRYRLRGHESNWRQGVPGQPIEYLSVPPGSYALEAEALLDGNPWTKPLVTQAIHVTAFRQRPLFFVLLGLLCLPLGGVAYLVRLRLQRAATQRIANERNRIARELHDSLAQYLAGIAFQLERTRRAGRKQPERLDEMTEETQGLVTRCLLEARQAIHNLRSHGESGTNLGTALHTLSEQIRSMATTQNVEVNVMIRGAGKTPSYEVQRHVLRVAQEAAINALLHAHASRIDITLEQHRNNLSLVVDDNGTGFNSDQSEHPLHFGLRGMHERAAAIGGALSIGPRPGGGTRVAVKV